MATENRFSLSALKGAVSALWSSDDAPARWRAEREHAWNAFLDGEGRAALELLQRQLQEIADAGGDGAPRAPCQAVIGRVLLHGGQPREALAPLAEAVAGLEACGDGPDLATALGDLANARRALGELGEALACAERAYAMVQGRGDRRREAAGLAQVAGVLKDLQRLEEAEARYEEALAAARDAGDEGLVSTLIQHLAILALAQGRHAVAAARGAEALARFQAAGNRASTMRTANLLGAVAEESGDLDEALVWYGEATRLARALGDDGLLAATTANVGILLQTQALAARGEGERRRLLDQARGSLDDALALDEVRGDEVGAAITHHQLGIVLRHLGDLDEAERHAQRALAFHEARELPDAWKMCESLAEIAAARGRPEEAAAWRARRTR